MAGHCKDADTTTFLEIDPTVIALSERRFSYLRDGRQRCASISIKLGDGRLLLRKEAGGTFDVIVGDAFASDSIPAHLLTRDAVVEFARVLKPQGILAYHTSSRYFELEHVVAADARAAGLYAFSVLDTGRSDDASQRRASSRWVFAARDPAMIGRLKTSLAKQAGIREIGSGEGGPVWTDQRHSLVAILRGS
jgi:spermidine synthase